MIKYILILMWMHFDDAPGTTHMEFARFDNFDDCLTAMDEVELPVGHPDVSYYSLKCDPVTFLEANPRPSRPDNSRI